MRDTWDVYFMKIALQASTRSTCDRLHVGAVIVKDKTVLSTGYNGSVRGLDHCDDVGHLMRDGHCIATVHAEVNAIVQAARNGVQVVGSSIYVSHLPCWSCFKVIANCGIERIFYGEDYRTDELVIESAKKIGINVEKVEINSNIDTIDFKILCTDALNSSCHAKNGKYCMNGFQCHPNT